MSVVNNTSDRSKLVQSIPSPPPPAAVDSKIPAKKVGLAAAVAGDILAEESGRATLARDARGLSPSAAGAPDTSTLSEVAAVFARLGAGLSDDMRMRPMAGEADVDLAHFSSDQVKGPPLVDSEAVEKALSLVDRVLSGDAEVSPETAASVAQLQAVVAGVLLAKPALLEPKQTAALAPVVAAVKQLFAPGGAVAVALKQAATAKVKARSPVASGIDSGVPAAHEEIAIPSPKLVALEQQIQRSAPSFAGMDIEAYAQIVMLDCAQDQETDLKDVLGQMQSHSAESKRLREKLTAAKAAQTRLKTEIAAEYRERIALPKADPLSIDGAKISLDQYTASRNISSNGSTLVQSNDPPTFELTNDLTLYPRIPDAVVQVGAISGSVSTKPSAGGDSAQTALLKAFPGIDAVTVIAQAKLYGISDESMGQLWQIYAKSKSTASFANFLSQTSSGLGLTVAPPMSPATIATQVISFVTTAKATAAAGLDLTALSNEERQKLTTLDQDCVLLNWAAQREGGAAPAAQALAAAHKLNAYIAGLPESKREAVAACLTETAAQVSADMSLMLNNARALWSSWKSIPTAHADAAQLAAKFSPSGEPCDMTDNWQDPAHHYKGFYLVPNMSSAFGRELMGALNRAQGKDPGDTGVQNQMKDFTGANPLTKLNFYAGYNYYGLDGSPRLFDDNDGRNAVEGDAVVDSGQSYVSNLSSSQRQMKNASDVAASAIPTQMQAAPLMFPNGWSDLGMSEFVPVSRADTDTDTDAKQQASKRPSDHVLDTHERPSLAGAVDAAVGTASLQQHALDKGSETFADLDADIQALDDQKANLSGLTEQMQIKVQLAMDHRSKIYETLSNLLKSSSTTSDGIIANIKP